MHSSAVACSPGRTRLFVGPSGVGKTTTVASCLLAALERGEPCVYYLFDETRATLLRRSTSLGIDLRRHLDSGLLTLRQVDPAEISPGEFASDVSEERGAGQRALCRDR